MLPILLALFSLLSAALALQSDLAGVADWHTALVGVPHLTPSPPRFVPLDGAHATIMVTEEDILAVLNGNGTVRWRQEVPDVLSFKVHNDAVVVLSGALGTNARLYDLEGGRLRWEVACGDAAARLDWRLPEGTRGMGSDIAFHNEYVFVLSEARRVTKIKLSDGTSPWGWEFPGDGSTNLFKQIVVNGDEVNVLGVLSSLSVPTLTHLTFNADSIMPISEMSHVPAGLGDPTNGYLLAPRGDVQEPGLRGCWAEESRYRCTDLYSDGTVNERIKDHIAGTGRRYEYMIDVGLREHGFMLGMLKSGAVLVVSVGDGGSVVAEFDRSRQNRNGMPVHSGAYHDGVFTFTRVYYDYENTGWKVQVISVRDGVVEQTEESVPLDPKHGIPRSCASAPDGTVFITTSTRALQLSRAGEVVYLREEALSDIAGVHFVELGEPETEEALGLMADETFVARLTRHIGMLGGLPAYIQHFVQRLSSTADIAAQTPPLSMERLHRDQFGLQKLIVAVSKSGKVYGLDSANGGILWSRNLGFYDQKGPELAVYGTWATRALGDRGNPQIAVVAVRTRDGKKVTLGYTVDAFTGDVAGDKEGGYDVPTGRELFAGEPRAAFLTKYIHCCTGNTIVGVVDSADTLHLFPKCKKVQREIEASPFFYTVLDRELEGTTLRGYTPGAAGEGITFAGINLWSRPFPAQEVLSVSPLHPSPVASFGRALGDKAVLYKYLNPHLLVVATVSPFSNTGHVYVVDTTTGASVHDVSIPHVVGEHVRAAMVENWLVYAWLEGATAAGAGGWRIASVELYERAGAPSSVGRSSLASPPAIDAVTQTFILGSDLRALTFTASKYGVTTKDVLYLTDAGQVAHLPRGFLDPRRPTGKPSKAEQEEMLIPYEAVIPDSPPHVVSHTYATKGLRGIAVSPALLESTTLLLAYGLDLFGSRAVQPSGTFDILGTGFAKTSLLLTLAALGAGVAVAAPSVRRKQLTAKWF